MAVNLFSDIFKRTGEAVNQALTPDNLRDFRHASKLFVDDQFRLIPKNGYLYHVFFDINQNASAADPQNPNRDRELGLLVKSVQLPKFTIDVKKFNAYNRPNWVQNKINYDALTIAFHDDTADVVRNFWFDYYNYYYRDADYSTSLYYLNHKYSSTRPSDRWGYTTRFGQSEPYLSAIRIYSLNRKKFSEYRLINPIIKNFRHGDHNATSSEFLQHDMQVEYEAVLYFNGVVGSEVVNGFADLHYDKSPSPLTPAGGGTKSILGQGGLAETGTEVINDLAQGKFKSAIFKGSKAIKTASSMDLKKAGIGEVLEIGKGVLRGNNPENRIFVPSLPSISSDISTIAGKISIPGIKSGIAGAGNLLQSASPLALFNKGKGTPASSEVTDASNFRSGTAPSTPQDLWPMDEEPFDYATLQSQATNSTNVPKSISQTTINDRGQKFDLQYKLVSEDNALLFVKTNLQKIKEQRQITQDSIDLFELKLAALLQEGYTDSSIVVQDLRNQISQSVNAKDQYDYDEIKLNDQINKIEKNIEIIKLKISGLK